MRFYTGVGSRETPLYILYMMSQLAMIFEKKGYILRSGCAIGADAAFEDALIDESKAEIYIPEKSFPKYMGSKSNKRFLIPEKDFNEGNAFSSLFYKANRLIHTYDFWGGWKYCKKNDILKLHNRNVFQVLGQDLNTKSLFTICYTNNKELTQNDTTRKTGGTGTAINISDHYKVPVFNLSVDEHFTRLYTFIKENEDLIDYEKLNEIIPRTAQNRVPNQDCNIFLNSYKELFPKIREEFVCRFNKMSKEYQDKISIKTKKHNNFTLCL